MQTVLQKAFGWNHMKLLLTKRLIKRTKLRHLLRRAKLCRRLRMRIVQREALRLEERGVHPDDAIRHQPFNPKRLEYWKVFRELIT